MDPSPLSEGVVFDDWGQIEDAVRRAYFERAYKAFSESNEGQRFIETHGDLGWYRLLLDFGLEYLGETVDRMSVHSVEEFLFEHVPRKVITEDDGEMILAELISFWEFMSRVFKTSDAKAIFKWLRTEGHVDRLRDAMSDPSNFGMSKGLHAMGAEAGFDMTTQEGNEQFMLAYNLAVLAKLELEESQEAHQDHHRQRVPQPSSQPIRRLFGKPAPIVASRVTGRNETCPCGSGKKFKKCCGRDGKE